VPPRCSAFRLVPIPAIPKASWPLQLATEDSPFAFFEFHKNICYAEKITLLVFDGRIQRLALQEFLMWAIAAFWVGKQCLPIAMGVRMFHGISF
jgi:hypothetical protein